MTDLRKLKVNLGQPEHGWLNVELSVGDRTYSFYPSYTPYDSIGELVEALLTILDGRDKAAVRWNDEPTEHEFIFKSKGNRANLRVYLIRVASTIKTQAKREPELVFAFDGSVYEVIRPFWKAIRDLQSRQSLDEYRERWGRPFPQVEAEELTERIKELRRKATYPAQV
jgi:deoxyribodipyrimidine photolyase